MTQVYHHNLLGFQAEGQVGDKKVEGEIMAIYFRQGTMSLRFLLMEKGGRLVEG